MEGFIEVKLAPYFGTTLSIVKNLYMRKKED